MKGVLKKYKSKGKGDHHDLLESFTEFKVIQKLAIKPCNYELLRNETKIQRNKLREILDNFTELKITIPHKYRFIDTTVNGYESIKIKTGLEYHILDLDNRYTLEYLRDIKLDAKVKYYIYTYNFVFSPVVPNKIRFSTKNKKILKASDWDRKEIKFNKLKQFVKIAFNFDPFFSLAHYILPDQLNAYKIQENKFLTKLREITSHTYLPDKKATVEDIINTENKNFASYKKQNEIKDDAIKDLLKHCQIRRLSRFDLLIFLSWSFPSQENYLKFWNAIKNHED